MGAFWILDLGLGRHFDPRNAFHLYCRAQDIERRVKTTGGGFDVARELQAAFDACPERQAFEEQAAAAAAAPKRKAAPKQSLKAIKQSLKAITAKCIVAGGSTRSGKRFRAD